MVDGWWQFVCPSNKGSDDPWINPFADGSPNLEGLECERVIITVAERDILREKGKMYYEKLVNSNWRGNAEIMETKGKDHVFHIFEPDCDEAKEMVRPASALPCTYKEMLLCSVLVPMSERKTRSIL
ncbi:hypothetical protein Bca4012_092250 [Brassica carinata]